MRNKLSFLILFFLIPFVDLQAQVVQYPVTATVQLNPPTSVYLTDYTSTGANKLRINLFQSDFQQPELEVRLKLTIEGNGISLQTNPNYNPPVLTLRPGQNVLTAMDLQSYLNPFNMLISGIDREALLANGSGLPEGMYRFCVQVFSHRSANIDLSLPGCYNAMLQKNYAPIPILPACASVVAVQPGTPNFLMQWQANANPALMTEYLLSLAQVPPGVNPNQAINGSQTPLLDKVRVTGTTFSYGPLQPELDLGKTYVYRIQARDPMRNAKFENDGLSQICTFQYGFGPAGVLNLNSPENLFSATSSTPAVFNWKRPTQVIPAQSVYYKLKVAEINTGQSDEDALKNNAALFERKTPVIPAEGNIALPENMYPLPIGKTYAWQVTAYSDAAGTPVEIAKSAIRKIKSAPAIANFVAGSPFEMQIEVTDLSKNEESGSDRRVTGTGKIKINEAGEERSISFTNALLESNGSGGWKLKEGEIVSDLEALVIDIDNSGEGQDDKNYNGDMKFISEKIILTSTKHYLDGKLNWKYPLAVTQATPVTSPITRIEFKDYKLTTSSAPMKAATFDLLEPANFNVAYTAGADGTGSRFKLVDNVCTLQLAGSVSLNDKVKNASGSRLKFDFTDADSPYYWTTENAGENTDKIKVLSKSNLLLQPSKIVFDLDSKKSVAKVSGDAWTGVYFSAWKITFAEGSSGEGQLKMKNATAIDFTDAGENDRAFIDAQGLDVGFLKNYTDETGPKGNYNTFPNILREIKLNMTDGSVTDSHIKGSILIPFVSETERFVYEAKFDSEQLKKGYFSDKGGLKGRVVEVGKNEKAIKGQGEKKIVKVTLNQAVFKDKDKLDITISAEWNHFDLEANNVRDFYIYGNGRIGFKKPNGGQSLVTSANSKAICFGMNADELYAGYVQKDKKGAYAFAFKTALSLGDDESGIAGDSDNGPSTFLTVMTTLKMPISDLEGVDESGWTGKEDSGQWIDADTKKDGTLGGFEGPGDTGIGFKIPISMNNSVVKLNGALNFIGQSPDWGNMVQASIKAELPKLESPDIALDFLIGCVSNITYWKGDILVGGEEEDYGKQEKSGWEKQEEEQDHANSGNLNGALAALAINPGKAKAKPEKPKNQWKWGKVIFEKLGGRLYYHMKPEDMADEVECDMGQRSTVKVGAESKETLNDDGKGGLMFTAPEGYVVDKNTKWGFGATVAMRSYNENNPSKHGKKWAFDGAFAMVFAESGGISGLGIKLIGSKMNTVTDGEIKSSSLMGMLCGTVEMDPFAFTLDLGVKTQTEKGSDPPVCSQGLLHVAYENGLGLKKLALGKPSFPITLQAKCAGPVFGGWIGYHTSLKKNKEGNLILTSTGAKQFKSKYLEVGVIFGKSISKSWTKSYRWCGVEAGFKAGFAVSVGVRLQMSPNWEFMDATLKLGLSASAEIGFTGYWCSFGSLEISAYLGGTGRISFQKRELSYALSGRLDLFGVFKPKVYLSGSTNY